MKRKDAANTPDKDLAKKAGINPKKLEKFLKGTPMPKPTKDQIYNPKP